MRINTTTKKSRVADHPQVHDSATFLVAVASEISGSEVLEMKRFQHPTGFLREMSNVMGEVDAELA